MTFTRVLKAANFFGYNTLTENVLKELCRIYHADNNAKSIFY